MRRYEGQGEETTRARQPRRARPRGDRDGPPLSTADIAAMDRAGLLALWLRLFGTQVPPKMSQPILRRFVSYELQARAQGGLPAPLARRLARIAAGEDRKATSALRPGARLLREWNGTTHVVDVTAEGLLWNGARHASLSAIARAITGARWSGPRFFGLTGAQGGAVRKTEPRS